MQTEDMLLKELEMARALSTFRTDIKYRTLNLLFTGFGAILALILKGDLPPQTYLLLALLMLLGSYYHHRLTIRQSAASGALLIAEKRMQIWAAANDVSVHVFDLSRKVNFSKRVTSASAFTVRIVAVVCLAGPYMAFAYIGAMALRLMPLVMWSIVVGFAVIAALTIVATVRQNDTRRRRFKEAWHEFNS